MSTGVRRSMKFRKTVAAAALAMLAFAALTLAAQKSSSTLFAQDKGKLTIKLDGQTVGHEDFELAPSGAGWRAKGTADITPPESPASKISGTLTLQPDGAPISYEWTAQAEKTNGAHIIFSNGVAKITLEMQGARPFEQPLSVDTPRVAVLANSLYHQYAV